jgi:hypothetical protein
LTRIQDHSGQERNSENSSPYIDKDPQQDGPTVQFNEINLGGGSLVSEDWKEGVKRAVAAATKAVGEDGREW